MAEVLRLRKEIVHPYDKPKGVATFVGLEHIESMSGRRTGCREIDMALMPGRKPRFHQDDIVYGYLRPYLNKVWVAEFDGLCSVDQYVYSVAPDVADTHFVAWFMRSPTYLERAPISTTPGQLPRIRIEEVASVPLLLPPLQEQRRVAERLTGQFLELERSRTAAEARTSAAKSLPTAYLRSVFNIPDNEGWPGARLGEVSELRPSKSIASDGDTIVSAITTACLSESGFLPAGLKSARMWAGDAEECVVESCEILVARSNTAELVGRAALFNGEAEGVVASDLTIRIWPGPRCHPPFLAGYLSYLYQTGYWIDRAGGASGSMKKITRRQIVELEIPLPPLDDQRAIASRLSVQMESVARLQSSLDHQLAAIIKLPEALLDRAFSG